MQQYMHTIRVHLALCQAASCSRGAGLSDCDGEGEGEVGGLGESSCSMQVLQSGQSSFVMGRRA